MRILKLSNKKYLSIIFIFLFFGGAVHSADLVDIWSVEEKKPLEKKKY